MTARPEFGAAIATHGKRLPWLPDDVQSWQWRAGREWYDAECPASEYDAVGSFESIPAIRLEVPRYDFVYLALERGMVPHLGGPKPSDWDGDAILFRSGGMRRSKPGIIWKLGWDHSYGDGDVIGYTRKATSTALPLAHPAAPQGEEGVQAENLKRTLTDALHFAVCTLAYHGRDRGTDRQEGMLDDLEQMARELDVNARAALAALAPVAIASGRGEGE